MLFLHIYSIQSHLLLMRRPPLSLFFIIHVLRFACTQWMAIGTDLVVCFFFCAVKHFFFYPACLHACVFVFWLDDFVLSMASSPVRHKWTYIHICDTHIGRIEGSARHVESKKRQTKRGQFITFTTLAPDNDWHWAMRERGNGMKFLRKLML